MLTERQEKILEFIVREYIKRAEPISSSLIVEKAKLDVSSATVRNELMALEIAGYLEQPYISAGRIPSDLAYQYFLQHFFKNKKLTNKEDGLVKELVENLEKAENKRNTLKDLAKKIADLTDETVILAFDSLDVFYTGISNLFNKPEFQNDYRLIQNLSALIDHLDEVVAKVFYQVDDEIKIYLGDNNPFHPQCSVLLSKFPNNEIIGILGPKRMNYEKNIAILLALKNNK